METGTIPNPALWIAGAFVGYLAAAHFLTLTALPLFLVQEVGLPGYGADTVKQFALSQANLRASVTLKKTSN